ncbi:proline-rich transmembrane protein 4 [Syngnathoides biaculeatus]|uniref:proline-rich transmembrane protein 4 n=1 Tax=Syngnathoides biaculeatus TaxID=300417 RepID=UPI002ADDE0AE|nr:proline-rich transmembrane protein 4 [Syngnathoides biaculeatus]XP_061663504.1 proline-rich transmembrane protein 4 [Syngnathoides biaculeatus]XP_061663505.1 proline-rich transmembrane protein 4 [Syngnathoides biaculeatus]
MLRLYRTSILCFWCLLLLVHDQASADEEGPWRPKSSKEELPQRESSSVWWPMRLPKLPSLPSLPFSLPFYPAGGKSEATELNPTGQKLSDSIDQSGSGDVIISEVSALPIGSTQEFQSSVTEIKTESLPTGTPHFSHSNRDNGTLVATSATHIRNTQSPTSSGTPEQNETPTYTPWKMTLASPVHQLPDDSSGFLQTITATMAPEIPLPTDKTPTNLRMGITLTPKLTPRESTAVKAQESSENQTTHSTSLEVIPTTAANGRVTATVAKAKADEKGAALDAYTTDAPAPRTSPLPGESGTTAESSQNLQTWDLMSNLVSGTVTFLPDCNKERSGACNFSDNWESIETSDMKTATNYTSTNQSSSPSAFPSALMLVPLYTDWNSAMAAWGLAWEAHVYGAGCVFAMLTLASALNLLCLPLRCPSGCGYFALVSLFLLAAGGTRSFSLLYDAYGHQDRFPSGEASLMLYEAPFPCLTAAFGLVFLLLSMRSRMQLSYSAFQRPCFLACVVVLHFTAAFGPGMLFRFYQQKPPLCLFLSLISRGAFVALATFLSAAYFVFYVYVRADSKHIYHLNNTSPTPAERYNRCPFAESRDWDRAAVTVCLSALFSLACAGLQLYAMLNAMGVTGGEDVFRPWCWWAFHFSCRLCELGVCLTLALVVAQPVYCSDQLPSTGSCWTELLASKAPILPGSCQWGLSPQEKLAIVDTVGLGETENLPLYTLMDERLTSSLNGLDFLYHSNRALAYRDLDINADKTASQKPENGGVGGPSGGSSFTSDSTTDLRPPSPINLRRSIDEALFGEALFPISLFSTTRPTQSSELSVNDHYALPNFCHSHSSDPALFQNSSGGDITLNAGELEAPPSPSLSSSSCSSPERWRGSSSSCSPYRASIGDSSMVLCPSPEVQDRQETDPHRDYQTLGAASQESLDLDMSSEADRSVQEEFMSACRQIDTLSISSETIDL